MGRTHTLYLLHFTPPYSVPTATGGTKTAGHYLGSTGGEVAKRVADHVAGKGSPLVRAAVRAGCAVELVATWPGGRNDERRLKRAHHHARLCPLCSFGASDG